MSESTEALLQRIQQLETENAQFKKENNFLKKNVKPSDQVASLHLKVFELEMAPNLPDRQSETYTMDGVEFSVRIEQRLKEGDSRAAEKFLASCSLYVKNLDSDVQKFVQTTMEVREKERYNPPDSKKLLMLCEPKTDRFVLSGASGERLMGQANDECVGSRRLFTKKPPHDGVYHVHIAVAVQNITMMRLDDDELTTVVVKNKEFRVSAQYLSLWSMYFRAYFRVDMKEKKEGRYPINDEDISPEDFEELLLVIYPTDRPITAINYLKLLKMASRFEMPELTRRIELFLVDFKRNELSRATVFRVASDLFILKLVQSTLLHRWRDARLMQAELLKTGEYAKLSTETKALVNQRFTEANIADPSSMSASKRRTREDRGGFGSPPGRGGGGFGGGRGYNDDWYDRDDDWYEMEREAMYAREEIED